MAACAGGYASGVVASCADITSVGLVTSEGSLSSRAVSSSSFLMRVRQSPVFLTSRAGIFERVDLWGVSVILAGPWLQSTAVRGKPGELQISRVPQMGANYRIFNARLDVTAPKILWTLF